MADALAPSQLLAEIRLPDQNLNKLTFCNGSKTSDVLSWANTLHATQVMQTGLELYKAVPELPRLKTDYKNRIDMLEALRPTVQHCLVGLTKHFLHQPIILPREAQKTAIIAQSIQKGMADSYTAAIIDISKKGKANQQTLDLLAHVIHRAITGISYLFLRSYQMYALPPKGLWLRLHSLYQVAQYFDIADIPIADPLLKYSRLQSIKSAYVRNLMMACSRCNQVSQNDVETLFHTFENWAQSVSINEISDTDAHLYAFDAREDSGPAYKSDLHRDELAMGVEINFSQLLNMLDRYINTDNDDIFPAGSITVPTEFSKQLFQHIGSCWNTLQKREQERKSIQGAAEVSVGLVDCHFFLCNGQEFDFFIKNSGKEEHIHNVNSFTPKDMHGGKPFSSNERPIFRISLQNSSIGGYCMLWKGDIPARVEAGQLLGVKEVGKRSWSIGVVRWIRQLKQASQLGIQLLSTHPKPYGIAQSYDMGGYSDYSRAIYIPSSRFGSSSASLLTPIVPFQEYDKTKILDGDQEWAAKLEKQLFASGNIKQFAFRPLVDSDDQNEDTTPQRGQRSNFESGWE